MLHRSKASPASVDTRQPGHRCRPVRLRGSYEKGGRAGRLLLPFCHSTGSGSWSASWPLSPVCRRWGRNLLFLIRASRPTRNSCVLLRPPSSPGTCKVTLTSTW